MSRISKALRYTMLFSAVGIIVTVLVIYVQRSILETYDKNLPYIIIGDHLQNRTTAAHLSFQKLLSGDHSISFENDVLANFKASKAILQGAYDGGQTELGNFIKPSEEDTRVLLKQGIVHLENLMNSANDLWNLKNTEGEINEVEAGKGVNRLFDSHFKAFQKAISDLTHHLKTDVDQDASRLSMLSWISVSLVFASLVFLCLILYRLQHGNDRLESESSAKLEAEEQRVDKLSAFIESVSAGNYDIELHAEGEGDNLTSTLVNMRDKLRKNAEDDRKRNWSTGGLAQIGEILRTATSTSSELFDNIVKFVVKYTKSNQAGLFIVSDDTESEKYLELLACYAFERKKYLTRKLRLDEGLVGQCYLEAERIYLLEVPEEYVHITSGLGGSNPNALLLVPLKVNDKVYGVLELASFNRYEEYEIELVEKFAESIASTISTVRVNETTRLLLERTQQQAEEMKSQEEEIRQNMEELEATQEEMRRKQTILEKELSQSQQQSQTLKEQEKRLIDSQTTLQAIVDNIPRAIFWKDRELKFMGCNKVFADVVGMKTTRELIGRTDFDISSNTVAEAYRQDDLEVIRSRKAKIDIEEKVTNADGSIKWILTSKVPVMNDNEEVVAILGIVDDITEKKKKENEMSRITREREEAIKELTALKHLIEIKKI